MRIFSHMTACFSVAALLAGCSTMNTSVHPDATLSSYTTYSVSPAYDPLGVREKITQRLMALGFNVVEFGKHHNFRRGGGGSSTGTGFVISEHGHFLTNYHVIEDASRITVKLATGETFEATLLRQDINNDIALLKINGPQRFKRWFILGDSDEARIGDKTFAVGFPLSDILGDKPRLTEGIISAAYGIGNDARAFQISAPIQPGNSGGPLLDKANRVIGITVSTLDSSVLYNETGVMPQNVNFAVKINNARRIVSKEEEMDIAPYDPSDLSIAELMDSVVLVSANLPGAPTETARQAKDNTPTVYVDFRYNYHYDIMHYTFNRFNMRFIDSRTGRVLVSTSFTGETFSSVDGILDKAFDAVAEKIEKEKGSAKN
jgi:hypothetical protein